MDLRQVFKRYGNVFESFTRKIRSKKNDELTTKADTAFVPDGVYILHETLGVRTVNEWNPKNNNGVVGILLVEDDHKIVVALEDAPENLPWSSEYGLINQPVDFDEEEDAQNDFNGEYYCQKLDSPKFPAAYYCKTYNKGGRSWYLPSSGELRLICNHFKEIQNALSIVGGQKLVATWGKDVPEYLSSTESSPGAVWALDFSDDYLDGYDKVSDIGKVRPVSKFGPSNTLKESFTRKIRSKKNDELTTKADTAFVPDGVYILHETLGVNGVEGWNPKNNNGVVGILLIEDDHKIVVATEDAPEDLPWSFTKRGLINQPVDELEDAESDFNGEYYCQKLNSPNYPAAYYCKTYNKGNRDWYLPSSGELWMIYRHLDEIQNALSIVGGQKFITTWDDENDVPVYWSSTERCSVSAWKLDFDYGDLSSWYNKVGYSNKVRPVSKFDFSTLKESFTRKIRSKKNDELTTKADTAFVPDGVYILHETLGVKSVEGWNPKNNKGVVGVLLIEDDHKIVVATEDAPVKLKWSKESESVNQPVENIEDAKSDFNGEEHCIKFNSTDFPAAYYCKTYNKGNRDWYLPSSGELWMIYRHLDEIQNALETVGGKKFVTVWDDDVPMYWSSTDYCVKTAWALGLDYGTLNRHIDKVGYNLTVRPVSKFKSSELKESFIKKVSSKKTTDLVPDLHYPDGVYIFHRTLGVKTVEEWNKDDNNGVIGILVAEDGHEFVVGLKDAAQVFQWSKNYGLVNEPIEDIEDAKTDFNGKDYYWSLNSIDFPASYYLPWGEDDRRWYLPSAGEMYTIYRNFNDVQNALSVVGGQKLITSQNRGQYGYWTSTEYSNTSAWYMLYLDKGRLSKWGNKVSDKYRVRPVAKFEPLKLKESFTKKIGKKNVSEIIGKSERVFLEESITQMVYSFGKYDMVQDIDKKHILGYELPFGCLPEFFEGNSNKVLDNGDVVKRTETRSLMGYTQTYEIIASHIYFNSSRKKVYVGMYRPSPLNQSESSPKIYNLYGAASSGILELSEFSIDELRQILQNLQERTKMKKPLRKKIVLKR